MSNFWGIINAQCDQPGKTISFIIVSLLLAQPIFLFSIGGWVTRVGIAIYLLCLISFLLEKFFSKRKGSETSKLYWWIIFSLGTYFLATIFSQIINGYFVPNRLDSPSRLLFSSLIFYVVFRYKIDFSKILQLSIPLSIAFFFLFIELNPDQIKASKIYWGRYALPFIDPILLSTWLTCFGLICITFINDQIKFLSIIKNVIFMLCFGSTLYMAFVTESRSGWLAIPMTLLLFSFKPFNLKIKLIVLFIALVCISYFALSLPSTYDRINLAFLEFKTYFTTDFEFNTSSVGIRMDMGSIAFKAFYLKPYFGWSEALFANPEFATYLAESFPEHTVFLVKNTGFHSDLYAVMVRSGALGLFAYLATFLTPLFLFLFLMIRGANDVKNIALTGLAVMFTCIIASATVEILSYKYSATIFTYLISGLMAQALWKKEDSRN